MASESLNGIVLSYSDYRDNDRILTLLTIEKGRVDCKVRNCRKPTAPFLACSQLFVYGEYTIFTTKQRTTLNEKYSVLNCFKEVHVSGVWFGA